MSLNNPAIAKPPPPRPLPASIQGNVLDTNTKRPFAQAKVVLFALNHNIITSTLTNAQGEYKIKVPISFWIRSGYYSLEASKKGYISQTKKILVQPGQTYTVNFSLKLIPNFPPKILRIQPQDNSTFLAGADVKIRVYAFDPEMSPLEYQFLIGGAIKQSWSPAHTYIWQTSAADTGTVSITCQVRDNKGAVVSRTITSQ